jgi:hypothetical protein
MAIPTFNDGDPIDASVIQSLAQEVAKLQASIPKSATAGTTINLEPSAAGDLTVPKFLAGISDQVVLKTGTWTPFTINITGLGAKPKSVILTQSYSGKNQALIYAPQIVSISDTSVSCKVRCVGGDAAYGGTCRFYYIAFA